MEAGPVAPPSPEILALRGARVDWVGLALELEPMAAPWLRLAGKTRVLRMLCASAPLTGGMLARRTPGAGANCWPAALGANAEEGPASFVPSLSASRRTGSLALGKSPGS